MRCSRLYVVPCLVIFSIIPLWAQRGESYGTLMTPTTRSGKLGSPESLRNYVVDGKLRLSLRDAIVLTLENNSQVRVQETQVETSKFDDTRGARAVRSDHWKCGQHREHGIPAIRLSGIDRRKRVQL